MKYDLSKKLTIGASRTLLSLQRAMLSLLAIKPFEEIAVQELCNEAMIPRATFYNYFDDKYDLLEYCFLIVHRQIDSAFEEVTNCQKRLNVLMDNFIDFFDQNMDVIGRILKHNCPNQYLINQIRFYMITNMMTAFKTSPNTHQFRIPHEMAAKLYSEAVLIILEWKYLDKKECSKEQAKEYLRIMVKGIDMSRNQ